MEQIIKILIVENDKDFAWLLQNELELHERLTVVGVCGSREEAVKTVCRLQPDIVLTDRHLGNTYEEGIQESK